MTSILSRNRAFFTGFVVLMIATFGLSSVSIAYTSIFCKMKMEEMSEKGGCCCKESKDETGMSCSEIPAKNEMRFESPDGCCCVVKEADATERNYTPVTTGTTGYKISHEGSLLYELPTPNNIPTLRSVSSADIQKSDGRSVLTLHSVLRI